LEEELEKRKISNGRILDLGTGPATQVIQLAKRGLQVTGSDVSQTAIIEQVKFMFKDKR
jgi:methylase of polypeptide subunit release factors